jgi:fido (protein-threonine AMPylation protein)
MQIWRPVKSFDIEAWYKLKTLEYDVIKDSWFEFYWDCTENRPEHLKYVMDWAQRKHALETGAVEGLYLATRGLTMTLIEKGIDIKYVNDHEVNISKERFIKYATDVLETSEYAFQAIKNGEPLTSKLICEMHTLLMRAQPYAEGLLDSGEMVQLPLRKGKYKEQPNNPTLKDGEVALFCPPEFVDSEMLDFCDVINPLIQDTSRNPIITAALVHYLFVMIHPFQDGNGRMSRLLANLVLIKWHLVPFTVEKQTGDNRADYYDSLDEADKDNIQPFINYFSSILSHDMITLMNLKPKSRISDSVFEEFAQAYENAHDIRKAKEEQEHKRREEAAKLEQARMEDFKQKLFMLLQPILIDFSSRIPVKYEIVDKEVFDYYIPTYEEIEAMSYPAFRVIARVTGIEFKASGYDKIYTIGLKHYGNSSDFSIIPCVVCRFRQYEDGDYSVEIHDVGGALPLNYKTITSSQTVELLNDRVPKMLEAALRKVIELGL